MKKLFIIGTYPNTAYKEEILNRCIDRLSNTDYDLMIVSHHFVPEYIQKKVDFVIYDKENTLEPFHLTPTYHHHTDDFSVEVNNNGHMMTVCRNVNNGVGLAKHLGYDFFYNVESDNIFATEDLLKLDRLREQMFREGKEMVLFGYNQQGADLYESLIFGGRPAYFLYKVKMPLFISDFDKIHTESTLETTFYHYLNPDEKDLIVIPESSESYFDKSEINKINNFAQTEILYDRLNNRFLLWVSNLFENPKSIHFKVDGSTKNELVPNAWSIYPVLSDNPIRLTIYEGEHEYTKTFTFTEEDKQKYKLKGSILYN